MNDLYYIKNIEKEEGGTYKLTQLTTSGWMSKGMMTNFKINENYICGDVEICFDYPTELSLDTVNLDIILIRPNQLGKKINYTSLRRIESAKVYIQLEIGEPEINPEGVPTKLNINFNNVIGLVDPS